jgi:hypothetical protein
MLDWIKAAIRLELANKSNQSRKPTYFMDLLAGALRVHTKGSPGSDQMQRSQIILVVFITALAFSSTVTDRITPGDNS